MTLFLMRAAIIILAGFSAISSIAGLGAVYTGAYVSMVVVGTGMELGKYSAAAYAYQEWQTLTLRFKMLLTATVTAFSLLTSLGVYGYLSEAFSGEHSRAQKVDIDLTYLTTEKTLLEARLVEIDRQIAEVPDSFVNSRMKLMDKFADERREIHTTLKTVNDRLGEVKVKSVDSVSSLGAAVHIARLFGTNVEFLVSVMTAVLSIALDMFALLLTILVNRKRVIMPVGEEVEKPQEVVKTAEPSVKLDGWNF